jgi:hypothetical protein
MPRNTHKNRTKLINNKRTNKQIGTLKKRRINKKRGGETKFSSFADVVDAAKDANLGKADINNITEKVTDTIKNVMGDAKINPQMLANVASDSTTSSNSKDDTITKKVSDALKVTSESQTEKVSDKEIITAVLDKYLDFLKKGIKTGETKESGNFVILLLSDNDKKKDLINEMISDKASYAQLWTEIGPSTKETLTQIQKNPLNVNIQEILDDIFYEFKEAEDIVNEITDKLKLPIIEKKLKKKQTKIALENNIIEMT